MVMKSNAYSKPKKASVIATLVVAILSFTGQQLSPVIGFCLAMLVLLMLFGCAFGMEVWPKIGQKENRLVFSLFWGLIIGLLIPFAVQVFLEEGFEGLYELAF
jgi:hypothetical protein